MRIVICDDTEGSFQQCGELGRLEGHTVLNYDTVVESADLLRDRLAGAQIAIAVRDRTVFDRESLGALPDLRLIAVTPGPNRIDFAAATECGVAVARSPALSAASIAEHVFAMLLSLARRIPMADQDLRARRWKPHPGLELDGKVLGILGLGRTGVAVAKRATAFGLKVIAWGPTLTSERAAAAGATMVDEQELFRTADILSVHLRQSDWSLGFVNAARIAMMRPSALLIDIAWAGIVDRRALAAALRAGQLAGAALDFCETHAVDMRDPIFDAPRTVLTPHLAWRTEESLARFTRAIIDDVVAYLRGEPTNVLNPLALRTARAVVRPTITSE